jgi:hypothetical protein
MPTYNQVPPPEQPVRHRCRNVRCGAKLKVPTDNPRRAFCCDGCVESYFRSRCLVCERPFHRARGAEHRRFCRARCRVEFNRHPERFSAHPSHASSLLRGPSKTPIKDPGFRAPKSGRPFAQIAGPKLSLRSLELASIPLDPEPAARLERAHRPYFEALKKSQQATARQALIKRRTWPVNIIGGQKLPGDTKVDLSPLPAAAEWSPPSRWKPATTLATDIPDIPSFLDRRPKHVPPPPPERPALCRPAPGRRTQSNSWTALAAQDRTEAWVSLRLGRGNH